jgi:hypothetical protein
VRDAWKFPAEELPALLFFVSTKGILRRQILTRVLPVYEDAGGKRIWCDIFSPDDFFLTQFLM